MLSTTNVHNVYLETKIYDNYCFFDRLISHVEAQIYYAILFIAAIVSFLMHVKVCQ